MSESYEDYEREYNTYLSRIRSFLASTRSVSTLKECERLLREAKRCAHAMQGLAELEGDTLKIAEARGHITRDINPLSKEVSKALARKQGGGGFREEQDREELFGSRSSSGYSAPSFDEEAGGATSDTQSLIRNSESLLMESQALCSESEQIGASTLQRMGSQREQLENAAFHLEGTQNKINLAGQAMREMSRKALRNKIFLYGVIAALVIANGAVIFHMFKKK
eukprot:CAMPEP_0185729434 /NCGR_PEP_ID=MMETSP1171-20130828/5714_1 /TAXON_ID=374046 /ORGANISM="Helicotheca tamensis, Strain CCMP826" /LENGTH=223 /DNA_ID=CAMNT_0028398271 /DNA_START=32 /DNA_END=703 /DNA_ORIENTATION=-